MSNMNLQLLHYIHDKPWQRIHVDFAGLFMGKSFLIVVNVHSKLLEAFEMTSTTSAETIAAL